MSNKTEQRRQIIQGLLVCPQCHSPLEWDEEVAACSRCSRRYPLREGLLNFADSSGQITKDSQFQADVMADSTITARLYNYGRRFISSEYMPEDHVLEFMKQAGPDEVVCEFGSGNRRLSPRIVNIDIFGFRNVDIVADIMNAPLRDNTVDRIVIDTVLEHVPEPQKVVDEIFRVLKPEGKVICLAPFIFPYHAYPKHYFNFSKDGLEFLFRAFSKRRIEMNMGPTSALINMISEYAGVAAGGDNKFLYSLGKVLALAPIFLFKYADKLWAGSSRAKNISGVLTLWAEK